MFGVGVRVSVGLNSRILHGCRAPTDGPCLRFRQLRHGRLHFWRANKNLMLNSLFADSGSADFWKTCRSRSLESAPLSARDMLLRARRRFSELACLIALASIAVACSNSVADGTNSVATADSASVLTDRLGHDGAGADNDAKAVADSDDALTAVGACAEGYKKDKDGLKCVQLKTCEPDNKPPCGKHAHCQPGTTGKDATCACDDGLEGDAYSADIGCNKNLLECLKVLDKCDHESTKCVERDPLDPANVAGLPYECTCLSEFGFTVQATSLQCKCPINKKIDGGACVCKDGFEDNRQGGCKAKCAGACGNAVCGVDKCGNSCGLCAANSSCDVTKCKCNDGYAKAAADTCLLNNVCGTLNQTKVCDKNATCVPVSPGANDCLCNAGYDTTPAGACVLGDKCKLANGGCSPNANCIMDLAAVVACTCKDGFAGDGKTCADIDECAAANGGCSVNAKCSNSPGAFTCACKPGFQGDGKNCADIDECAAQVEHSR